MPPKAKPGRKRKIPKPQYFSSKFLKALQNRENGLKPPHTYPETVLEAKAPDYALVKSHAFNTSVGVEHTGYLFRPGKNAIAAAWYVYRRNSCSTAVGLLHYNLKKVPRYTKYEVIQYEVADVCQLGADPDCFASIVSCMPGSTGELHISYPGPPRSETCDTTVFFNPRRKRFRCVNSCFFTRQLALGGDSELYLYSASGIDDVRPFEDNIYSLAYNTRGTVLSMGSERGNFFQYDIRSDESVLKMHLDSLVLDDVIMLDDDYYCVVSGASGYLSEIDMRMNRVCVKFEGHNRRRRRIPVSVNELTNILCASGGDQKTRIWSLKNGKLLYTIENLPSSYPHGAILDPDSFQGKIYLIQDNFVHMYSMFEDIKPQQPAKPRIK